MNIEELAKYYERLEALGDWIVARVNATPNMSMEANHDGVNPYWNQIKNDGSVVLELYYGLPCAFHTPLGKLRISQGSAGGTPIERADLIAALERELKMTLVEPKVNTSMGVFGPLYALGQDHLGNPFNPNPNPLATVTGLQKGRFIPYQDAMNIWKHAMPPGRGKAIHEEK